MSKNSKLQAAAADVYRGVTRIKYSGFSFLSYSGFLLLLLTGEPLNVVHRDQRPRLQNEAEELEGECGGANESIQHRELLKSVFLFLARASKLGISTNQLVGKWGLNVFLKFQ